ncbi:MAG TPA: glycosyltransferase family A protein [Patescibacteria group bacterium]|nr:glycosyltransferase family A protein [Patescibacteria group bacterium]
MILENVITPLIIIFAILWLILTIYSLIKSLTVDVSLINQEFERRRHPYKKIYLRRPSVTIVLNSNNNSKQVLDSLKSIFAGTYKKVQVIINDQSSDPENKKYLRQINSNYSNKNIRIVFRRSGDDQSKANLKSLKKYATGEYIVDIEPGSLIHKNALINAINQLNSNFKINAIKLTQISINNYSLTALVQQFINFRNSKKLNMTLINSNYKFNNNVIVPIEILKKEKTKINASQSKYSIVYTQPPKNIFKLFIQQSYLNNLEVNLTFNNVNLIPIKLANLYLTLITPIFIYYILYLSLRLHEPTLFILSLLIFSTILIVAIWQNTAINLINKIYYCLTIPILYFFYILISLFNFISSLIFIILPKSLRPTLSNQ